MATEKQKSAARQNIKKAQTASKKGRMDIAKRDQAWKRIKTAAKKCNVEIEAGSWRGLVKK
ncbi:MAG: hypothetical protein JF886_02385 [Candidatus Dormibacteraeota bacterium]|uniref:Uncharacterized protein n=1 Tax=Candidatus Aeolococcus gillhamiae TaxID=3127015 RepID=A0A934N4C1_9BACT|nr:hypothetical protein [Candidatus Dormibacteraeota bacterium]